MVSDHAGPVTSGDIALTESLQEAISQTILDCLSVAEQAFPDLGTGAGARTEAEAIREVSEGAERWGRLTLHRLSIGIGNLVWNSGRDYFRAVAHDVLRRAPLPIWSTTSLVRSALEAEANFAYLYKRESNVSKRIGRTAAILLNDEPYVGKVAKQAGGGAVAEVGATVAGLRRICEHAGVEVIKNPKTKKQDVHVDGARVGYELIFANVIREFWPEEAGHPYDLLSGAAHSRPWMLSTGDMSGPTAINVLIVSGLVMSTWLELAGS